MQVKEVCRNHKQTGETVVEFEAGNQLVRLIDTYNGEKTLEEMLYVIACQKLTEKVGKTDWQHCVKGGYTV